LGNEPGEIIVIMHRILAVGRTLGGLIGVLCIAGCAGSPIDNAVGIWPEGKQQIADERFMREYHICEMAPSELRRASPGIKQRVLEACSAVRSANPHDYSNVLYATMLLELAGPNGSGDANSPALHQQGQAIMWNFIDSARGNFVGTAFFDACEELRYRYWPHDRLCNPLEFARAQTAARAEDAAEARSREETEQQQEQMQEMMMQESLERQRE
jgi:hypothetical protein